MIQISDKSLCTGCTACVNACPAQCIVIRRDREGFDYPVANPDLCINCGKCEKICPVLHPQEARHPLKALAARSETFLEASASGGVFPALAKKVIEEGGIVYGAVLNEDMTVGHADAEDMIALDKMRGSKYVQSDLYSIFEEVGYELEKGREVMFTGTPCQIAGLKSYLGKEYDNLLAVDCACHGVPGPGLWEKYIKALESAAGKKMSSVRFRDKSGSWLHYDTVYCFAGEIPELRRKYVKDPYMALFVQNMSLRPSCYNCPVKGGKSMSDLTLADLWNVAKTAPQWNDDRGLSLVLVYSNKGSKALERAELEAIEVDSALALSNNGGFCESIPVPERRAEFFKGVHSTKDLLKYMKAYMITKPLPVRIYKEFRALLAALKRRIVK